MRTGLLLPGRILAAATPQPIPKNYKKFIRMSYLCNTRPRYWQPLMYCKPFLENE